MRKNKYNKVFKQRVKNNDLVYTRSENGVTRYTYKNDKNKKADTIHKSTGQEHNPYKHISDREAKSTTRRFKE